MTRGAPNMGRFGSRALAATLVVSSVLIAEPVAAFSSSSLLRTSLRTTSVAARQCPRLRTLRASLREPVEGGADGSMERILGNIGLGKIGQSIDWLFDTSTISGAKAWRQQMPTGEADALQYRKGDELEEMLQDQISSRTLERDELQTAMMSDDEGFFSDQAYSLADDDLSGALTSRLQQLAYTEGGMGDAITGAELALLCYKKYGLYHDMALKCDMLQLVSDKKLVSVNIYYAYFGQLSPRFQYSEADYLIKCDLIASAINQWNQAPYVREFFAEAPKAYRGLPSRPRWDTAVSIRLYKSPTWTGANIDEWFMT